MRKRAKGLLASLFLCGGTAFLLWRFLPREPLLLDRATRITRTDDWYDGGRFHYGLSPHWLSNDELLYSHFEGPNRQNRILYRRNIKTGVAQPLLGLSHAVDAADGEVVDAENVSPDGRWFVRGIRWYNCLLASVDGSRSYVSKTEFLDAYNRNIFWFPDSRHWMERYTAADDMLLFLHDVRRPKARIPLPVSDKSNLFRYLECIPSMNEAIAVQKASMYNYNPPAKNVLVSVYRGSLGAGKPLSAVYRIPLPHRYSGYEVKVSPRGDQLAWEISDWRTDNILSWLHRYLPFVKVPKFRHTELSVSKIDGSDRQRIGFLNDTPSNEEDDLLDLRLQWLPDEKHLSFEYKEALYLVPVQP